MLQGESTLNWSRSKAMTKMHQAAKYHSLHSVTCGGMRALSRALYAGPVFFKFRVRGSPENAAPDDDAA